MSVAASSLSFIDGSILNVALPAIRAGTGAGAAEVQWVVNIYTLPLAALILVILSLWLVLAARRLLNRVLEPKRPPAG